MSKQIIKAFCRWCNEPLAPNHKGKCPKCGKKGKNISAIFNETITLSDTLDIDHIRTFYAENKLIKWVVIIVGISSPFIGLWIGGWFGVVVGLLINIVMIWLPPAATIVKEIVKYKYGSE